MYHLLYSFLTLFNFNEHQEDLERAQVHFKNCLFFKENDILILIHLSVVLLIEGRLHEAKFFISRILTGLEQRVKRLQELLGVEASIETSEDEGRQNEYNSI